MAAGYCPQWVVWVPAKPGLVCGGVVSSIFQAQITRFLAEPAGGGRHPPTSRAGGTKQASGEETTTMAKNLRSSGFGIAQDPSRARASPVAALLPAPPRAPSHEARGTRTGKPLVARTSLWTSLWTPSSSGMSMIHPSIRPDRQRQTDRPGQAPSNTAQVPIAHPRPPARNLHCIENQRIPRLACHSGRGRCLNLSFQNTAVHSAPFLGSLTSEKNTVSQIAEAARCSAPLERALAFFAFAPSLRPRLATLVHAACQYRNP